MKFGLKSQLFRKLRIKKYYIFQGKTQNGYMSMCAAINRTLEQGIPLTDPGFYGKITEEELEKYFIGDDNVSCPMIKQRVECLHEISKV